MEPKVLKLKVCLVGEEAVGKTSLIRRFVTGQFDESYIRTLGAVVTKKTVRLKDPSGGDVQLDMVILDIMGKRTFMQLFKDAYFSGARGVLAVFDMTRKSSLKDLMTWINGVRVQDYTNTLWNGKERVPATVVFGIQVYPGSSWGKGNLVRFRKIMVREL